MADSFKHQDYTVGWVCALPIEQTAAWAMLDEKHPRLASPKGDDNAYMLGSIGGHNIVIACLPKGRIGVTSASTVVTQMVSTFTAIRFALMVGIGGGIPSKVSLGDVVVSTPTPEFPGVVQWDLGKTGTRGFRRTGALSPPPASLLSAISRLESAHEIEGSRIEEFLEELKQKHPRLTSKYCKSAMLQDWVFPADYPHVENAPTCQDCDLSLAEMRTSDEPRIHYGLIASGNQVVKSAQLRDELCVSLGGGVLCIEMEAAGLMNKIPTLAVRGICDYADSHKNKDWQPYAAAVAAAFSKELLLDIQPAEVSNEQTVKDLVEAMTTGVSETREQVRRIERQIESQHDREILDWLSPTGYGSQQTELLRRRQPGTGQWFLNHENYGHWLNEPGATLFCPGIPGAGKTMLAALIIDDMSRRYETLPDVAVAYVYCDYQRASEQTTENVLSSLLRQLVSPLPHTINATRDLYGRHANQQTRPSLEEILRVLHDAVKYYSRCFIIMDALDELEPMCRRSVLSEIFEFQARSGANILATARHITDIKESFKGAAVIEISAAHGDVLAFLSAQRSTLPCAADEVICAEITAAITKSIGGMFLLARLYLDSLKNKDTRKQIRAALARFTAASSPHGTASSTVYDTAYEDAMERIEMQPRKDRAKQIIMWITCARRPLTIKELQYALAVEAESGSEALDEDNIPTLDMSICAGLVTVEGRTGIVRFIHFTTQEYFRRAAPKWFPNAEQLIVSTCLAYLSYKLPEEFFEANLDLISRHDLVPYPFYPYSVNYWVDHARLAQHHSSVLQFLKDHQRRGPENGAAPVGLKEVSFHT
ncbi:uncharacterized protein B0I36DRAFT_367315 [Microdochium trichocladiopsis]|uniref:NACHT domain-containing protein n=1 Tax=Microdochium trichocladiopsis TaxID=1682393 RepID=A0A9P9BKQ2_9PEZI|nr:uncharacterized protein B0I36DRAFT_367315 [Microdochium trichocladiopsis]KAH7020832.1 hypothetical protein B0I36DRAFT_367315 [Microdochium trichocladiopsis]